MCVGTYIYISLSYMYIHICICICICIRMYLYVYMYMYILIGTEIDILSAVGEKFPSGRGPQKYECLVESPWSWALEPGCRILMFVQSSGPQKVPLYLAVYLKVSCPFVWSPCSGLELRCHSLGLLCYGGCAVYETI